MRVTDMKRSVTRAHGPAGAHETTHARSTVKPRLSAAR